MSFWNRKKTPKETTLACDTGKVQKAKAPVKRNPPAPLEVKLLAMEIASGPARMFPAGPLRSAVFGCVQPRSTATNRTGS